jgi:ABC-type nitrate/sulfonate/bicarbonate transport system substrate-binding protein
MPSTQGGTTKLCRDHQKVQPTLSYHFISPKRKWATSKKKHVVLQAFGHKKHTQLEQELEALKQNGCTPSDDPFIVEN